MAYISEGLGNSYDSEMVMKYQMQNGSVLNSPSATAASLTRNQNAGCLHYLTSLLEKFGDAGIPSFLILPYANPKCARVLHFTN